MSPRLPGSGPPARAVLTVQRVLLCLGIATLGCGEDEDRTDVEYRRPDPAVAVLPFVSSDPDLRIRGVDLARMVALDLDGVADLRAVDPRYVRSRLDAAPPTPGDPPSGPDLAVRVGSETGARYAVGGMLERRHPGRLTVSFVVYDIEMSKAKGGVDLDADPHEPWEMADLVAAAILARLPDRREASPHDAARVTTASATALGFYLTGERHLDDGRLDPAFRAYERAIAEDPRFGLAHLRLAEIAPWMDARPDGSGYAERAVRWGRSLPPREIALAKARLDLTRARPEGLEALRLGARRWPDDPDAWFLLGQSLFLLGPSGTAAPDEVESSLRRATARAPAFAPAWVYRIDFAITRGERRRAAGLLDTLRAIAPEAWFTRDRRLRFALAFGDPAERDRALEEMESPDLLSAALETLGSPLHLERQREVLATLLDRGEASPKVVTALAWNRARSGEVERALELLDDPELDPVWRLARLYALRSRGLSVPEERIEAVFEQALQVPVDGEPGIFATALFFAGAWAVERGHDEARRSAIARLRRTARSSFEDSDSLAARLAVASARGLEGFIEWTEEGDRHAAVRRLEGALHDTEGRGEPGLVNAQIRWWLAEIHRQNGDLHQALTYYGSFWDDPYARAECGAVRAALGHPAAARADYAAVLTAWRDPDPDVRSRVGRIQRALDSLPPIAATPQGN